MAGRVAVRGLGAVRVGVGWGGVAVRGLTAGTVAVAVCGDWPVAGEAAGVA
jgi:hypothetical protein